ncbi:MAG: recombinase family protein [bacterium]|nr:recombinase family protein [bacterium]
MNLNDLSGLFKGGVRQRVGPQPKTAVIYVRVSSSEQVQNTSLGTQERVCREFAQREGLRVLEVFRDKGESAKTADRPQFMRALAYCLTKKNQVGYFVVYKLDRFSRNQFDHAQIRAMLKHGGVELRSATESIDETSMGQAMEGMLSVFANFDNNVRKERTKAGMLARATEGKWVWPSPLGYYRPAKSNNIVPDPKSAPHIRTAFEEYAKGTYTFRALTELLIKRGLRTLTGKKPRFQEISKTLRKPVYCGIIHIPKWGLRVKGSFEPIITEELFANCQGLAGDPSPHALPRHANNPEFPLRKLVVCEYCHKPLTGSTSTSKGKKYPNYHHHFQNCPNAKSRPKKEFERQFVDFLKTVTPDAKYEKLIKALVLEKWEANFKGFDKSNAGVRREIALLEQERLKVFELHRMGKYTDDEFQEQKALVMERIHQKESQIQTNRLEEFDMDSALTFCFNYVRHTARTWTQLESNYTRRLRFQKLIFDSSVHFDGQKFGNAKLTPVYRLNQEFGGQKSKLVAQSA